MAARNRASRRHERALATCQRLGHAWGERIEHHNDPFTGSPHLPGGLVGWSQTCTRCDVTVGRGEY
jgi:hypothetical protein